MTKIKTNLLRAAVLPLIATAVFAIGGAPAQAAAVTQTFSISASGFEAGAPIDSVTGIFSFAYDNSRFRFFPSATGLTISGFNLDYAGDAKFTYQPNGDILTVGNNIGFNSYSVSPNISGFGFFLRNPSSRTPWISSFAYSTGAGQIWHASVLDVAAVPEPASWAMMIAGFGLAGAAVRRRRGHSETVLA